MNIRYRAPLISVVLVLCISAFAAHAQTGSAVQPGDSATATATRPASESPLPSGANFFGRFETIAVGSFPISLFYVGFGFDLAMFFSNGFNPLYAPWPFKSNLAPPLVDSDKILRLSAAAALSVGIAIIDAIILPRAVARREADLGRGPFPVPPPPKAEPSPPVNGATSEGATNSTSAPVSTDKAGVTANGIELDSGSSNQ
jgi:hypothetical protein